MIGLRLGYFLSSEEFSPADLVEQAKLAEQAGFEALWISDHFHPWNDQQGESGFVWSVIGAISQVCRLPITTAVTCPIMRIHPAIVAQAAATSALLTGGRFRLGVGTGEALNEHILGDRWPPGPQRLAMLEEAIGVMRKLFTGEVISHHGPHYTVEQARLYSCPSEPVPIYMSAFGPKATELAGRIADGFCGVAPDADLVKRFRDSGGEGKPTQAGLKVCVGDREEAVERVHRTWPNDQLPGELPQVLPTPQHFMQASSLVTREMVSDAVVCGEDVGAHVRELRDYADAGYDEVYVNQIGPEQERFFAFYAERVLPELSAA